MQISARGTVFGFFVVVAVSILWGSEMPNAEPVIGPLRWCLVTISIAGGVARTAELDKMFLGWFPGWWHRVNRPDNPNRTRIIRP